MAPTVWYHVRDLDEGRRFYQELLGFEEVALDLEERWSILRCGEMEIGLAQGEPRDALRADGRLSRIMPGLRRAAAVLRPVVALARRRPPREQRGSRHDCRGREEAPAREHGQVVSSARPVSRSISITTPAITP